MFDIKIMIEPENKPIAEYNELPVDFYDGELNVPYVPDDIKESLYEMDGYKEYLRDNTNYE